MDVKELEAINGMSVQSDAEEEIISIKKGAWSSQEDSILINYIANHGEGRWNHLARNSGLKRAGKSCRLRWKNYLQPNVRRGNLTLEEQLRIIELHCFYGNRWSKIAEFLPGRTDNEIKNYWRTIVQKQAKQLKCDINSIEFREFIRNIWLPRLSEQIHASKSQSANNFDDMIINFEAMETNGPQTEMDYWANLSGALSSEPVEINPVSVVQHNLSKSDGWFSTFTYGLDCGQDYFLSPFVSYGSFQGIDCTSACFSSGELSDTLLRDKYFWHCP